MKKGNVNNESNEILKYLQKLKMQSLYQNKKIKRLQRLIYLLQNNIKLYKGKRGGIYYLSNNNQKIYVGLN
jgi:transposase